jgi:2OG-Fe(II) oxygenase superfamily
MVKFQRHIPGTETTFVKGPKEEVITVSFDPEEGLSVEQVTKFDELVSKVRDATKECAALDGAEFDECFAGGIANDVLKIEESRSQITKYRNLMSARLRNYTCADEKMQTSKPLRSDNFDISGKRYKVDYLFESEHAKIWTVPNFISDEECATMEKHAKPRLARATVAAEDGTNIISNNRRANQAGYNLHQVNPNDPLVPLQHRILHMTNHVGGYQLTPEGQEDFTVIQYGVTDEYHPHCDGTCDGSRFNPGGRVATALMYCKTADAGGATTFTKADVFVRPTKGTATFFSYKGPDEMMDEGFTEHSGCPVLKGDKWVITFWMRAGVDANNPWTIYDPSGVPIVDTEAIEKEISVTGDEL